MANLSVMLGLSFGLLGQIQDSGKTLKSWEKQLEPLAREIRTSLSAPPKPHEARSLFRIDRREIAFWNDFQVAEFWPHDSFRDPLLHLLRSKEPEFVVAAARSLLLFDDPAILDSVKELESDTREYHQTACIVTTVGYEVTDALRDLKFRTMTVPLAMRRLQSLSTDEWLSAFEFLRDRGIVLDPARLASAWPRLKDDDKLRILKIAGTVRVGRDDFRATLESLATVKLIPMKTDPVETQLYIQLASLDSAIGRRHVIELLKRMTKAQRTDAESDLVIDAFRGLAAFPDPVDVPTLLAWVGLTDREFQRGALCVLSGLELPSSRDAMTAYLCDGQRNIYDPFQDPLSCLSSRDWNSTEYKWHYIRTIANALVARARVPTDGDTGSIVFDMSRYIGALESMTQVDNGWCGMLTPDGHDLSAAKRTAESWGRWVERHDPTPRAREATTAPTQP